MNVAGKVPLVFLEAGLNKVLEYKVSPMLRCLWSNMPNDAIYHCSSIFNAGCHIRSRCHKVEVVVWPNMCEKTHLGEG